MLASVGYQQVEVIVLTRANMLTLTKYAIDYEYEISQPSFKGPAKKGPQSND